jgi:geranylgeranyl diphosphate synthase type I
VDLAVDLADFRERVGKALSAFLSAQRSALDEVGEELGSLTDAAADLLLDGGKRMRPAFAYWGWRGAGGADSDEVVATVSALELLHACALVHDDVMDRSDTRRGRPAAHRRFAAEHRVAGWPGDPEAYGGSTAILLGDLCLVWADAMLHGSGLEPAAVLRARPVYEQMRTELMAGQYLDVLEQYRGDSSLESALRVARYKTAKYTVERPLQLGGVLADAPAELLAAYSGYGLPLGEAFQLRDDVLGVFGDPETTGKPAGDDLREGKRTALVAAAGEKATPRQQALLRRHLGDPALDATGLQLLREVIVETGALARVESLIAQRVDEALGALSAADVAAETGAALTALATATTLRRL